jgi:hypothetical protein
MGGLFIRKNSFIFIRINLFKISEMNQKLTLSLDKKTISKAKGYAKKQGRSLSNLVENLLKVVTTEEKIEDKDVMSKISPEIRSLVGVIKAPKDFDYKKELGEILWEKYSK